MRNYLLAAAAGLTYDTPHAPEAPEHPVAEVPVPRLVASMALDLGLLAGIVATAVLVTVGLVAAGVGAVAGFLPMRSPS